MTPNISQAGSYCTTISCMTRLGYTADANGVGCSNAVASCHPCVPSSKGARMRVVVDLNRCLGYAQCVFLAPSVFRLNGEEALQYDPNPDDAMRQKVLRAAAACPVQAILVEHLSGKEGEATS